LKRKRRRRKRWRRRRRRRRHWSYLRIDNIAMSYESHLHPVEFL